MAVEIIRVVTDTLWGDGGKGKLVDIYAQQSDLVIRYGGGANAGHTIVNEHGEFKFNLMPSGIFNPEAISILGTRVVVDPGQLYKEMQQLHVKGIDVSPSNLLISDTAHVVMPWHKRRDGLEETARGGQKIGTTGKGIGPAYSDRTARVGLRMKDLFHPDFEKKFIRELHWQEKLTRLMDGEMLIHELPIESDELDMNAIRELVIAARQLKNYDEDIIRRDIEEARDTLAPFVTNVFPVIQEHEEKGKKILGEGAQGALLDLDLGGYPYVTSSHNPGLPGFLMATGIQHRNVDEVIGVAKAYTTRVGDGPMPTEVDGEIAAELRQLGKPWAEVGTTTGRLRRVGWFDGPANKLGARIAQVDAIALTKVDVLDRLPVVEMCIGYRVDGKEYTTLPSADPEFMARAEPITIKMKGWQKDTTQAHSFNELPREAQAYVKKAEEIVQKFVRVISVGQAREATIFRSGRK